MRGQREGGLQGAPSEHILCFSLRAGIGKAGIYSTAGLWRFLCEFCIFLPDNICCDSGCGNKVVTVSVSFSCSFLG